MKTCTVIFAPSLNAASGRAGRTVLEFARDAGVHTGAQCDGRGTCGKCRVRVLEGGAGPLSPQEIRFISAADRHIGCRLACMVRVTGDLTVLVPGEHILTGEGASKAFTARVERTDPAVRLHRLSLRSRRAGRSLPEGVVGDLRKRLGRPHISVDPAAVESLEDVVNRGGGTISAALWMEREVIAALPGNRGRCLGVALDVGTTTVAAYLCDLGTGDVIGSGSVTNPQVLFGADIMSRISYSVAHPDEGVRRMQRELMASVNALMASLAAPHGIAPEEILDMTVVGNTVMHHIFLGVAPDSLGLWPFTPSVRGPVDVKALSLGLAVNPGAYVHALPVEAGFVGADNVAVLLSQKPHNRDEISLIVDLGTNGEIVLGNREGLLSCSCATGPAFEGAQISCGMRAAPGAIEKVRVDPATLDVDCRVIGAAVGPGGDLRPAGLCGSGIIDAVAELFKAGVIANSGAFSRDPAGGRVRSGPSGVKEFVLVPGPQTATGRDIVLTQKDVRQVQLAKAALHAGCRTLMGRLGIGEVPKIFVAGAFGMHIDMGSALAIGLFPACEPGNIVSVGNAAGHGAFLALVDRAKRTEAEEIARHVAHIELAREEVFQKEFRRSLAIPYGA